MEGAGRSNGLYFDREGFLWACADAKNELWRISPSKEADVVVREFEGKLLNAPNDLWIDPKGGIYFTDPFYKRDYWDRGPMEQPCQGVYYLTPVDRNIRRVVDDMKQPNGLIGTPDGKTLYISDLGGNTTWKYSIGEDGALSGKTLFCSLGSDGMTLDNQGNVYLTGKGVTVFNADGNQIHHVAVDEPWTANVCFGGQDRDYLFITASTALYRIKMAVEGVTWHQDAAAGQGVTSNE
jgi:gluconolactonase